jgi:hypothetical protein
MKWHVYENENDYESGMSKDSRLGLGQGDNRVETKRLCFILGPSWIQTRLSFFVIKMTGSQDWGGILCAWRAGLRPRLMRRGRTFHIHGRPGFGRA